MTETVYLGRLRNEACGRYILGQLWVNSEVYSGHILRSNEVNSGPILGNLMETS